MRICLWGIEKNSATVIQRNGFASCIPVAAVLSNLCANYDKTPIY